MSTRIASLFLSEFSRIEKELDTNVLEHALTAILLVGAMAKFTTYAGRKAIVIGTPLGNLLVYETSPLNPNHLMMMADKAFMALYPSPEEHYLTEMTLDHIFGTDKIHKNIGWRLLDAYNEIRNREKPEI